MFASSFRILVAFAIVLEVRGIFLLQIPWTAYGRSSFQTKDHNQSALDEFSILYCESASSTLSAWVIRKKCWASLDILIYASTTQKNICSFELSLFSCILTSVYQVIVRNSCAIVFVSVYYLCGPSSRSISEWLGEINSSTLFISRIGSKQLYFADQNATQLLILFYPGVLPSLRHDRHENCTISYEFLTQRYFLPSLFIPRFLCYCNRNADKWIVMCEIYTPSNSIAW